VSAPGQRLRTCFATCHAEKRAALVIYLTAGDPRGSLDETVAIVRAAAAAGADVIELGVPFSDPSADGAAIQRGMERALAAGAGLTHALDATAAVRASGCEVPIVLFGYYNPIFVMGVEAFAARAARAGVDAVLTVDLPVDELDELRLPLEMRGVGVVPLVAPTSTRERVLRVGALDPPFVYYISLTGVTGASMGSAKVSADRIREVRELTGSPVAVGFGIKTAFDARAVGKVADGVVVGSAVVARIGAAPPGTASAAVADLVAELRAAL
jgi:tryptophan synthase alpha chain